MDAAAWVLQTRPLHAKILSGKKPPAHRKALPAERVICDVLEKWRQGLRPARARGQRQPCCAKLLLPSLAPDAATAEAAAIAAGALAARATPERRST